jgi:cell division protein FtsL
MSPRAAAAAVARGASTTIHAPVRTRTPARPAPSRRRSGAVARPRTATRALPRYDFVSLLDKLLRGPAYIALVGVLLAGIVFFNVDVLELNHGIARTDSLSSQLKRQNAALTLQLAKLGSSERIQTVAAARGLVLPQPGDVRYLRAHRTDAARALRVMTAPNPSGAAAATPAVVSQQSAPTSGTATVGATTISPATTVPATTLPATTSPAATTQPATTPTATPAQTATSTTP